MRVVGALVEEGKFPRSQVANRWRGCHGLGRNYQTGAQSELFRDSQPQRLLARHLPGHGTPFILSPTLPGFAS